MSAGPRGALALPALGALLAAAAFLQGGFHLRQLIPLTAAAAAAALFTFRERADRGVLLGFGILAAGLLASAAANSFPDAAAKPALTLGFCAALFLIADRAASADRPSTVCDAVVAVAAGVATLGLVGVAFHIDAWAFFSGTWRLESTLTYQNAAASLLAIALPAALARNQTPHRVAAVLLTAALGATGSRAGAVAAVIAATLFVGLAGVPAALLRTAIGAGIAGAALAPALAGKSWGAVVAVAGIAAGCAVAASPGRPRTTAKARTAAGIVIAVVAAGVAVAILTTPLRDRFSLAGNDRTWVWSQSIDLAREDPVFGTGPGTYRLRTTEGGRRLVVLHAHNEYVQAAVETGLIGLACVAAAIGLFGRSLLRARSRDPIWAAATASGAAFLFHSAFDFLWRVPVLPATAFVLLAASLARRD